jgi:heptosyltransferase-2
VKLFDRAKRHLPLPSKVMVRVPNWVGDAVMAVPALRELRRIFAGSHIAIVARSSVAELFEGEGLCDDLIQIKARSAGPLIGEARLLRRQRFDAAVLLQNAFSAALFARAINAGWIAGYPTDGRRLLLDVPIPLDPHHSKTHQVFYYLKIAAHLEQMICGESRVEMERVHPHLHVAKQDEAQAMRLFEQSGIEADRPIVAISPGATNSRAKRWLPERFAEVADLLAERNGFQVIIVGTEDDSEAAFKTASHMRSHAHMLAGRTNIRELKALLAHTSLVVSNDTGTAHLSAALGVPTVVIFGPTQHLITRPLSDKAAVVRRQVACSPCMLRDCPIDHRCMTGVEVADVYQMACQLLKWQKL